MLKKEKYIERYFNMWLSKDGSSLNEIFDKNIIYSECYGPEYRGIEQIVKWFDGVSIIGFNADRKITDIKEFQSQVDHEFPYS